MNEDKVLVDAYLAASELFKMELGRMDPEIGRKLQEATEKGHFVVCQFVIAPTPAIVGVVLQPDAPQILLFSHALSEEARH